MKKLLFISPEQYGYLSDHYYLAQYAKKEYELTFICFDKGYKKIEADGLNLIYMNFSVGKFERLVSYLMLVISLCKREKFDIVFCVDSKITLLIGFLIKAPLKILDIRTASVAESGLKRWTDNFRTKITSVFFDKITIISEPLITTLKLPQSKCSILALGATVIDNSEKKYDKLHLIYVGTLQQRAIEKTIDGLALFIKNRKVNVSIHYDIIGFGKEEAIKIHEHIKKNELEKIIFFHGRKHHSELQPFFENATVGVCFVPQTSFYDNQPPTKLFEYAMSGLINISTNTSESRKYINAQNGVICEDNINSFAKALAYVYDNLSHYSEVDIRTSLSDFSWENIFRNKLQPVFNQH